MGSTSVEKILASHCGRDAVNAGEYIDVDVDLVVGNEGPAIITFQMFDELGCTKVFDRNKIALFPDHTAPNKDIGSAEICKTVREFARRFDLPYYFEVGRMGISHVMVPEIGLVAPGDVSVGADSHTCTYGALGAFGTGMGSTDMLCAMVLGKVWMRVPETIKVVITGKPKKGISGKDIILNLIGKIGIDGARYKAIEFTGDGISHLSMADRFTISNMVVEAGAKCGLFPVDEKTAEYLNGRCTRPFKVYVSDPDAVFDSVVEIDLNTLDYQVAMPSSPSNVCSLSELEKKRIKLDQVFLGSCTNGRYEDLEIAARVLKGRKVHKDCRMIVIPGSQRIYLEALESGVIKTFIESECAVSTPTCGACVGTFMGILASEEVCASTTNRNFVGRMGHTSSKVYLVSPIVAAASAIAGYLVSPQTLGIDF